MRKYRDADDVKATLAKKILGAVDEAVWVLLVDDGYIDEVLGSEPDAWERLMMRYRTLRSLRGRSQLPVVRREQPPDALADTLALILVDRIGRTPAVQRFRERAAWRRAGAGGRLGLDRGDERPGDRGLSGAAVAPRYTEGSGVHLSLA
jgi:hypothetical protein